MLRAILSAALTSPQAARRRVEVELIKADRRAIFETRSAETSLSPTKLSQEVAPAGGALDSIVLGKRGAREILRGHDPRLLVVAGPPLIEDFDEGFEYATRLKSLAREVGDHLVLVMKTSFCPPEASGEGLIIRAKLRTYMREARRFVIAVSELGVPCAAEFFDPVTPHFLNDLIVWSSVSEKTSPFCTPSEVASSVNCPVGVMHHIEDGVWEAIESLSGARSTKKLLGVNQFGEVGNHRTLGNPYAHLLLPGISDGSRDPWDYALRMVKYLRARGLPESVMIRCALDAAENKRGLQALRFYSAVNEVIRNRSELGGSYIRGMVLESVLREPLLRGPGSKPLHESLNSKGDFLGWERTEGAIRLACEILREAHV